MGDLKGLTPGQSLEGDIQLIREARGLSREDIFNRVHIQPDLLKQVELEGFVSTPSLRSDIHRRSFIKHFADAVGIDSNKALIALQQSVEGAYDGLLADLYLEAEDLERLQEQDTDDTEPPSSGLKLHKPAVDEPDSDEEIDPGSETGSKVLSDELGEVRFRFEPESYESRTKQEDLSGEDEERPKLTVLRSLGERHPPPPIPEPEEPTFTFPGSDEDDQEEPGEPTPADEQAPNSGAEDGSAVETEEEDSRYAPAGRSLTTPPESVKEVFQDPGRHGKEDSEQSEPELKSDLQQDTKSSEPETLTTQDAERKTQSSERSTQKADPSTLDEEGGTRQKSSEPSAKSEGETALSGTEPELRREPPPLPRSVFPKQPVAREEADEGLGKPLPDPQQRWRRSAGRRPWLAWAGLIGVLLVIVFVVIRSNTDWFGASIDRQISDRPFAVEQLPAQFSGILRLTPTTEQFVTLTVSVPDSLVDHNEFSYKMWTHSAGSTYAMTGIGKLSDDGTQITLSEPYGVGGVFVNDDGRVRLRSVRRVQFPRWEFTGQEE